MMIVIGKIFLLLSFGLFSQFQLVHSSERKGDFFFEGARAPCNNEMEEITLNTNIDMKCFRCICQNGFIECEKKSCPATDDCYTLVKKTKGNCCDKCKECHFNGQIYESGSEWNDPEDPCLHFKCIAGVVTESVLQCYSPCNNPLPPRKNECCPTCLGCQLNGQKVDSIAITEELSLTEDPCVKCQCNNRRLTCVKKACPVLQCPPNLQFTPPGSCCKKCSKNISYTPMKGGCLLMGDFFPSSKDKKVKPDVCSLCTCHNETSVCSKKTCPVLECLPMHQETKKDECCPTCKILSTDLVTSTCTYKGVTYKNNETWNLSPCKSCECKAGEIRCAQKECPRVKCRANENFVVPQGQCCAKCIESPGVCTVFVPHYKTFDGKFFSFQGACKYQLSADCSSNHTFSIRITNDIRQRKISGRAKTITFKTEKIKINLGQKLRIKVNGSRISLPFEVQNIAKIYKNLDGLVVVESEIGIKLIWDGNNFLQLEAPVSYKGKLCGLCGNYNNIWRDDLKARSGVNVSENEMKKFAESWRVGGFKACSRRPNEYTSRPHHCSISKKRIAEKCRELKGQNYFGNCISRVNPEKYFDFCKNDLCECSQNQSCHCESFTAYAAECVRNGINLPRWRKLSNCELKEFNYKKELPKLNRGENWKNKNLLNITEGTIGPLGNNGDVFKVYKKQRHQNQDETNKFPELLHRQHIPKVLTSNNRTPPPLH